MAPMRDGLDGENGLIGWQKQQARPLRTPLPLRFRPFSFRPRKPLQSPLAPRAISATFLRNFSHSRTDQRRTRSRGRLTVSLLTGIDDSISVFTICDAARSQARFKQSFITVRLGTDSDLSLSIKATS